MPRVRDKLPDDVAEALGLVKGGKLFALQQWIKDGKRIRIDGLKSENLCCLFQACVLGFHSIVEVLLMAESWPQSDKDRAVNRTMSDKNIDMADLLLAHGADVKAVDFKDVCRTMDLGLMERFLRAGVNPASNNSFARALDETSARPLLRFYKSFREEFPALNGQAALALAEAVRGKRPGWTALLAWAGADPFLTVPEDIYGNWDIEEGYGVKAAELACHSGDSNLVKVLRLQPSTEEAQRLLCHVSYHPVPAVMKELLRVVPKELLNTGERMSCEGVEHFVNRLYPSSNEEKDNAAAACLELLLDAGARWNPDPKEISRMRKNLCQNTPRYVVRVVRLLLYVQGAADLELIADLCNTPLMRRKIYLADDKLNKELEKLEFSRAR